MQHTYNIPLNQIKLPKRKVYLDNGLMLESVRQYGLHQDLYCVYTPVTKGLQKYELIDGLRRFHAFKMLGHKTVPCVISKRSSQTDKEVYFHTITRTH